LCFKKKGRNRDQSEIEKKLKIKRKKTKNLEKGSTFLLLSKPSNFNEELELNERDLFIFIFKSLSMMFVMHPLKSFITLKAKIFVLQRLNML
jgi:hypothetical protein